MRLSKRKTKSSVHDKTITEWQELLTHKNVHTREIAATALARIGPSAKNAVPRLSNILVGRTDIVRENIPLAERIGFEHLVYEATRDKSPKVRAAAAYALGEIGPKSRVKPLLESALTDPKETVRNAAILALMRIRGELPIHQERIESWEDFLSRKQKEGWKGW